MIHIRKVMIQELLGLHKLCMPRGMTTADIQAHIREIYGIVATDSTVSQITGKYALQIPIREIVSKVFSAIIVSKLTKLG